MSINQAKNCCLIYTCVGKVPRVIGSGNTLFDGLGTVILKHPGFMFVLSAGVPIGSYAPSFPKPADIQLLLHPGFGLPELWCLSLLTGRLPVYGCLIFGHRPEDYSMSWSFTAIQVFPVCWLSPCAAKHSVMGYVLSQSQQWTSLSCETQEICLWPSGHCLGCSNRKMDVTFPKSLSRMRKPIISPLLFELSSSDTRKNPCPAHLSISLFIPRIAEKTKG